MRRYIFLDFDGTISDAHSVGFKAIARVLDEYKCGFDKVELLKLMGEKIEILFKEFGLNGGRLDSARRRFYKYFKKGVFDDGVKLCVSVEPLWELKKHGHRLIVISNSETSFVKLSAKKLGIKRLFYKIYGAEKFETKDKLLEKLFRKYKIKPKETIFIGDRFSDVQHAKKVGCVAVAIHNKSSWSDLKTIKKEKPDYIIKDFSELKKIIKNLTAQSHSQH